LFEWASSEAFSFLWQREILGFDVGFTFGQFAALGSALRISREFVDCLQGRGNSVPKKFLKKLRCRNSGYFYKKGKIIKGNQRIGRLDESVLANR
jgi:hypothetical protein